ATAENGGGKSCSDDYAFGLGVRVLAGDRALAPGYLGLALGAADVEDLPRVIRDALERAYRRALVNAEMKADAREKFGPLGAALADTRLHPIDALEDTVAAVYERDPRAMRIEDILAYTVDLARQAVALSEAPALPTSEREVVVVTDPHYNTLVSHEIIGHPVELDRALKMETAYAGRSWLLRGLDQHQVGKQIASPLVTAFSDPGLPGYGHYRYDHEGTPARRVVHIAEGVFRGF